METDQMVLCSFLDAGKGGNDKPTGQLVAYNLKNGQALTPSYKEIPCDTSCLACLDGIVIDNNSHFVVFSKALSTFQIVNFGKEKPVAKFFGHEKLICIVGNEKFVFAGTSAGSVCVWQISNGEMISMLKSIHFQAISSLALSGHYLVTASEDGTVKVWDYLKIGIESEITAKYSFADHTSQVSGIKLGIVGANDCRLYTCGADGNLFVYDLYDGLKLAKFVVPSPCTCLEIDALERMICIGSADGAIYLLNLEMNAPQIQANIDKNGFDSIEAEMCLRALDSKSVTSLCFSIDNGTLVAGYSDGKVLFWDIQSRQLMRTVTGTGAVTNIKCFFKSPITKQSKSVKFTPFNRNMTEKSLGYSIDLSEPQDDVVKEAPKSSNTQNDLASINHQLFEYIKGQVENN